MDAHTKQTVMVIGAIAAAVSVVIPVAGLTILVCLLHDGETTRELVDALTAIANWGVAGLFALAGVTGVRDVLGAYLPAKVQATAATTAATAPAAPDPATLASDPAGAEAAAVIQG